MDASVAHSFVSFSLKALFRVEFCYLKIITHDIISSVQRKERNIYFFGLLHLYFINILLDWMHDNEKIINRYDLTSHLSYELLSEWIFFFHYYIFIFLQLQFLLSPNCQYNLKKENRKLIKNQLNYCIILSCYMVLYYRAILFKSFITKDTLKLKENGYSTHRKNS